VHHLLERRFRTHSLVSSVSVALGIMLFGSACLGNPVDVDPTIGDAELRVLFIGNSLTYTNDLPAMVQTIAEAAGHTLAYGEATMPNASLEDHWYAGIEETIRHAEADVVVLQQGPSSLPQNQEHLRTWTETFTEVIRDAGGEPVLFMVWPEEARLEALDAVYQSYSGAAVAVGGIFAPAGEAWRYAWEADAELVMYGPDGFHPSTLGSQTAALTIFRALFEEPVNGLPARLEPETGGLPIVDFSDNATIIYAAVENAFAAASTADGEQASVSPAVPASR
jgi:hypothetical protein